MIWFEIILIKGLIFFIYVIHFYIILIGLLILPSSLMDSQFSSIKIIFIIIAYVVIGFLLIIFLNRLQKSFSNLSKNIKNKYELYKKNRNSLMSLKERWHQILYFLITIVQIYLMFVNTITLIIPHVDIKGKLIVFVFCSGVFMLCLGLKILMNRFLK